MSRRVRTSSQANNIDRRDSSSRYDSLPNMPYKITPTIHVSKAGKRRSVLRSNEYEEVDVADLHEFNHSPELVVQSTQFEQIDLKPHLL